MGTKSKFRQALSKADKGDTDIPVEEWGQMTGLMTDYGHGEIWEDFTEQEAIEKIERVARELEED